MSQSHLSKLGNRISMSIKPDEDGFTGRECPHSDCEGYFKIEFGTGLEGRDLPCHCPYCGHTAAHDHFWTKEQVKYIESVVTREVTDAIHRDFKEMEFNLEPKGPFGIGFSLTFKPDGLLPIHHYREKQLETDLVCTNCTLHYSVYGVFRVLSRLRPTQFAPDLREEHRGCRKDDGLGREHGERRFSEARRERVGGLRVGL